MKSGKKSSVLRKVTREKEREKLENESHHLYECGAAYVLSDSRYVIPPILSARRGVCAEYTGARARRDQLSRSIVAA